VTVRRERTGYSIDFLSKSAFDIQAEAFSQIAAEDAATGAGVDLRFDFCALFTTVKGDRKKDAVPNEIIPKDGIKSQLIGHGLPTSPSATLSRWNVNQERLRVAIVLRRPLCITYRAARTNQVIPIQRDVLPGVFFGVSFKPGYGKFAFYGVGPYEFRCSAHVISVTILPLL
jgi:hypothetical protein